MTRSNSQPFTRWHVVLLKFLRKLITTTNIGLLRISRGRLGNSFLGVPVLLLTTTGRKSGQPRTQPLYFLESDSQLILVASNAGTAQDPSWLLNLCAQPIVTVNVRGQTRQMKGHVASPEEKAVLWPQLTQLFPQWQMMEDRSGRAFKVVVLESLN
ncbi:Deazaflavin-dependent nitroreductase [Thermoflexales bacterium]|nr:Deazaflavin-dependent nitroreductase [Thermoflexales bacterium]